MMLEDISDDDDYQTFKQRKETVKKNLVTMAIVSYDQKPEQRQQMLSNIDLALDNEEQIYKFNRKSIKKINRESLKLKW